MKLFINVLIFIFTFLIIRYLCVNIKYSLEGFCAASGNSKGACAAMANSENGASAEYTKKLITDAKRDLTKMMEKVSKSVNDSGIQIQKNKKGIEKNIKNANSVKAEIAPD